MRDEVLERRVAIAEKLSLAFEDVHVDGNTGEVIARRHSCPGRSFRGFGKHRHLRILGYVAKTGEQRPGYSSVRPR